MLQPLDTEEQRPFDRSRHRHGGRRSPTSARSSGRPIRTRGNIDPNVYGASLAPDGLFYVCDAGGNTVYKVDLTTVSSLWSRC